ncbi:MAG: class I tRNA ligase family protein, partial [Bacteroidota bacterium]|nr:class I tRNA ligase family protein [Bacteroidota bacterium]
DRIEAVQAYKESTKGKSERERMAEVKKITGEFTGAYASNPFSNEDIPIWIADYVLAEYGTGAIMAVPGHDSRDWAFAKTFQLPIKEVIEGGNIEIASHDAKSGILINSGFLNDLPVDQAIIKAVEEIEKKDLGKKQVNYRLRDANFSRQRYWGEPIPVIYKDQIPYTVPENELPVTLPEVDSYKPAGNGESPLAGATDWVNLPDGSKRETNTMPGWAGAAWYYLRYMNPHNQSELISEKMQEYWQNVDFYVGGSEHATGHLLYARFWMKFLYDIGHTSKDEPFSRLINQGMIQGRSNLVYKLRSSNTFVSSGLKDDYEVVSLHVDVSIVENDVLDIFRFKQWRPEFKDAEFITEGGKYICGYDVEKMSKSKYNVVTPDEIISKYGCDAFRLYEMFLGPVEQSKPWSTEGIDGVSRFTRKLWNLYFDEQGTLKVTDNTPSLEELKVLHHVIKRVTEDINRFSLNTCVSSLMIAVNELSAMRCSKMAILESLSVLISPFTPHLAEELWYSLGNSGSVTQQPYPMHSDKYLKEESFEYPVSVNGKTRAFIRLSLSLSKEDVETEVLKNDLVNKWIEGKPVKKVVVVSGRIVNVVV